MSEGRFAVAVALSRAFGRKEVTKKRRGLFGLNADIPRGWRLFFNALPFLVIIIGYGLASHFYLAGNPNGKLLPSFVQMAEKLWQLASVPERRSGEVLLLVDSQASLQRITLSLVVSATIGLFVGLTMTFYPLVRSVMLPFVTFFSNLPIIATLAIIMIIFGTGELFKFVLIFLGTVFIITRDVHRSASAFPEEQITKALSLGASEFAAVFRLMLPQVMPHLLYAVRMVLGTAWIYLISSEMIASQEGLGYRIFLVRRYMDMQTIIPYVFVVTAYAFALDGMLRFAIAKLYPWYQPHKD